MKNKRIGVIIGGCIIITIITSILILKNIELNKLLKAESQLHQESIATLSRCIQDYDNYVDCLEDTIREWRIIYDINDPLVENIEYTSTGE